MSEIKNVNEYLKKVSKSYSSKKKITDILNNFRLLTPEYQKFNETNEAIHYSSPVFSKCTEDEQDVFVNTELITLECVVCNSIYEKYGIMYNWKNVYDLIHDPIYKTVEKINRKVVYSSMIPVRPVGETAFDNWNGLQIIDLDIKNSDIAETLKPIIFDELKKYHWFLGITKSASGKSLHVWTKITPISIKAENKKVEYFCNFRHKYSYVYIVLTKYAGKLGYEQEQIEDFMDMAMAKPQQGIFIPSDNSAMLCTNFLDRRLDVNFEPALDTGVESIDWISHPALKSIFSKLEWFHNEAFDRDTNLNLSEVSNITDRNIEKNIKKHYKHAQRWQLANTLTNIYGYDKALQYMLEICKNTPYKELKGDCKTAEIHQKPISIWAVKQLNEFHGFNIKFEDPQNIYIEQQKALENINEIEVTEQPTGLQQASNLVTFHISKNQYLGHIKDDIIENLSHITLLEAGAGYGKTEMIKAFKAKTCLILPFTSTIKAKVEKSETTEDWLYYYGNKRPTLDELLGNRNMSMTIDKFSRLNVMELDQAGFEYIVLDESHLLFTSSYRDVMAPTIQRLANCKAKIIMMTGTPTGELTFFPGIKHIKVIKEDTRIKDFEVHFCPTSIEQLIETAKMIADDIIEGRKVLFPTNDGNIKYEQLIGLIQECLDNKNFGRQLNSFYYKKSNYGDESMDNINYNKTIGNNDIIFCSTYLSVGVDIWDRNTFSVYFNTPWIPQDIEQFANRLRNNDLHVKLVLPKLDDTGFPINYYFTQPLDLSFNTEDLLLARDLIRTCNDMIERNNEEAKSNPLIQSLIAANKYLKYDENACKYYIDETMYKLKIFEERYSQYNKQLTVLLEGIRYYGYTISQVDHAEQVSENRKLEVEEYLKSCRHRKYNEITTQTFAFLNRINDNNIDVYREIIKGNLDILRGKDDNNTRIREDNAIYAESIEIVERNTPIVLSLYKYYDCDTIKSIYEYCIEKKQNRINYTKLNRIRKFISIVNSIKKERLDFPIYKFVTDAKRFAVENPVVNKDDLTRWINEYSVKIANNVKDVVVEDVMYLEVVKEHIEELWKIIVTQSRPKDNKVTLTPFELLWQTKDSLDTVYGGNITKTFFMQELIDEMKPEEITEESYLPKIDENTVLPDIELTSKVSINTVKDEVQNIVNKDYDYYKYSEHDGSNDRFMEKQRNTNSFRDTIFDVIDDIKPKEEKPKDEIETLF
jgi:hypothetical protein